MSLNTFWYLWHFQCNFAETDRAARFLEPVICFSSKHCSTKAVDTTFQQNIWTSSFFSGLVLIILCYHNQHCLIRNLKTWRVLLNIMLLVENVDILVWNDFQEKKWVIVSTRTQAENITLNIQLPKRRKTPYTNKKCIKIYLYLWFLILSNAH